MIVRFTPISRLTEHHAASASTLVTTFLVESSRSGRFGKRFGLVLGVGSVICFSEEGLNPGLGQSFCDGDFGQLGIRGCAQCIDAFLPFEDIVGGGLAASHGLCAVVEGGDGGACACVEARAKRFTRVVCCEFADLGHDDDFGRFALLAEIAADEFAGGHGKTSVEDIGRCAASDGGELDGDAIDTFVTDTHDGAGADDGAPGSAFRFEMGFPFRQGILKR